MPVSQKNNDIGVYSLLSLLAIYTETDQQPELFLVKDGVKIIL